MTELQNDRITERQKDKSSIAPTFSKRGYKNKFKLLQKSLTYLATNFNEQQHTMPFAYLLDRHDVKSKF